LGWRWIQSATHQRRRDALPPLGTRDIGAVHLEDLVGRRGIGKESGATGKVGFEAVSLGIVPDVHVYPPIAHHPDGSGTRFLPPLAPGFAYTRAALSWSHMHPDEHALRRLVDELFIAADAKDWQAARGLFAEVRSKWT
jgi:hypothetical protein